MINNTREVDEHIFLAADGELYKNGQKDQMDVDNMAWTPNTTSLMPFLTREITETWDVDFRESSKFWAQLIMMPIVVIIGMLGNIVTTYILTRKQMQTSSNVYLTSLAISDFIFLLFSFSMSWKHYDCMKNVWLYWEYAPFGLWIRNASCSTSVWLTVSFTIERYIAVCHPLLGRVSVTGKRAKYISCIVCIICFLLTFFAPFEWRVVPKYNLANEMDMELIGNSNSELNNTVYGLQNSDLDKKSKYQLLFYSFIFIFFLILPLVILIIINVFLIHAVKESRKKRDHMTNSHLHNQRRLQVMRREDRIAFTLILVVIVFIICQVPTAVLHIYTSISNPAKIASAKENILLGLGDICNLLVTVYGTCNFILYNVLSERFRQAFSKALSSHYQSCGNSRETQMAVIYFRRDYM